MQPSYVSFGIMYYEIFFLQWIESIKLKYAFHIEKITRNKQRKKKQENQAGPEWWHLIGSMHENTFLLTFKYLLPRNTSMMWYLNVIQDTDRTNGLIVISQWGASASAPHPSFILAENTPVTASRHYTKVLRVTLTHPQEIIHTGFYCLSFKFLVSIYILKNSTTQLFWKQDSEIYGPSQQHVALVLLRILTGSLSMSSTNERSSFSPRWRVPTSSCASDAR